MENLPYIDAHAHPDQYNPGQLDQALKEIESNHIITMAVSMDIPSYERNCDIAVQSDFIIPSFGIHPWNAHKYAGGLERLDNYIDGVPAIGEIGLDFHWVKNTSRYFAQIEVFEYFLSAAREQQKTVNIHTKGAEDEIVRLLKQYDIRQAIIHWYSGPFAELENLVEMGLMFTAGVEVLVSEDIRKIIQRIPVNQILTETDNPGGYRYVSESAGYPSLIINVVEAVAAIKDLQTDECAHILYDNFSGFCADNPWLRDEFNALQI